jgi:RsiW-degrading membrane proteinase PrsW (M82 family)
MTTFVVAALVVAVLFADRLVSPEDLRRRLYQVALAVAVVLAVLAFAALVRPSPGGGAETISPNDPGQAEAVARVLRERTIIVVGIALLSVLLSLNYARLLPTTHVGPLLAGIVLMVISASDPSSTSQFLPFYFDALTRAGELRNGIYFGVAGLGSLYLLRYGYNEWDREDIKAINAEQPVH